MMWTMRPLKGPGGVFSGPPYPGAALIFVVLLVYWLTDPPVGGKLKWACLALFGVVILYCVVIVASRLIRRRSIDR